MRMALDLGELAAWLPSAFNDGIARIQAQLPKWACKDDTTFYIQILDIAYPNTAGPFVHPGSVVQHAVTTCQVVVVTAAGVNPLRHVSAVYCDGRFAGFATGVPTHSIIGCQCLKDYVSFGIDHTGGHNDGDVDSAA